MRPLVLIALLLVAAPLNAAQMPTIRVLLDEGRSAVAIRAEGGALTLADDAGKTIAKDQSRLEIAAGASALVWGRRALPAAVVVDAGGGRMQVGERTLRGRLRIVWRAPGSCLLVNELPLEEYLVGLVGSELFPDWPVETMKAQAVAARTYALTRIEGATWAKPPRPYDIGSSVLAQVYHGAHRENPQIARAVAATRGEVLERNGRLFPAYYHSCCGGRTEHASNVWPGEAGPPTVAGKWCARTPRARWELSLPKAELEAILTRARLIAGPIRSIATTELADSPRVDQLLVETDGGLEMIKATELRRLVGYEKLRSTWFTVRLEGNAVRFSGRGFGHGVGMCQWGAKGMADAGKGYREILRFYYPDAAIKKTY